MLAPNIFYLYAPVHTAGTQCLNKTGVPNARARRDPRNRVCFIKHQGMGKSENP